MHDGRREVAKLNSRQEVGTLRRTTANSTLQRLALGLVCALLAACGSTVPLGASQSSAGGNNSAGNGLAQGTNVRSGSSSSVSGISQVGGTTLPGPGGVSPTAGTASTPITGAAPGTQGVVTPGAPIQIGVYAGDAQETTALFQAFGYTGDSFQDPNEEVKAVFDDLNKRGGIYGHPVKPIVYLVKAVSNSAAVTESEACAKFTQDNKVSAVIGTQPTQYFGENLLKCLQKMPVVGGHAMNPGWASYDQFRRYPLMSWHTIAVDRLMRPLVDNLFADKYFDKWDYINGQPSQTAPLKIGVVAVDTPSSHKYVNDYLVTALKRHNLNVEMTGYVTADQSSLQNIVLQFHSRDITHVLFPDGQILFWGAVAESQHYRPRAGLASNAWPQGASGGGGAGGLVPPAQLVGSLGIGWDASLDLPGTAAPAPTAPQRRCMKLMEDVGQDMSSQVSRFISYYLCQSAWLLEAAYRVGKGVTPEAYLGGMNALAAMPGERANFTVSTYQSYIGAGRHDTVSGVRRLAYDVPCDCFKYTSGIIAIG